MSRFLFFEIGLMLHAAIIIINRTLTNEYIIATTKTAMNWWQLL